MIPGELKAALETQFGVGISTEQPIFGGDINQAARVTFQHGGVMFVKWNRRANGDFFQAEAHGLRTLAASSSWMSRAESL